MGFKEKKTSEVFEREVGKKRVGEKVRGEGRDFD